MTRGTALALLSAGCAAAVQTPLSAQIVLPTIRCAGVPTEDATSMFWAVKTGVFERVGLDVQMIDTAGGAAATTAMIAGSYEVARPSIFAVILAHLRNIDVKCISAANLHDAHAPMALLQVAGDSAIRTATDLNGKTVGVPSLNELNTVAVRAWSDKNGGDWRSIKFIEIPNSTLESALAAHRIDAGIVQSPFLWTSLESGTTRTLGDAWSAVAPRFLSGVNAARSDWAVANRDVVRRFVRAYYGAVAYANVHRDEMTPFVAQLTHIDVAVAQKLRRSSGPTAMTADLIQPVIDAATKYAVIDRSFSARDILFA